MPLHLPVVHDQPVESFDPRDGTTWRRTGACCRCGECCVGDPYDPEATGMCSHFVWEDEVAKVGRCDGRDSAYYLAGCAVYPQYPDQVADKPGCSYVFSKRVETERVT